MQLLLAACSLPALSGRLTTENDAPEHSAQAGEPGSPTNTDGAQTLFIPGGTFMMGSPSNDNEAERDEMPQHPVTLQVFYIYRQAGA